VTVKVNTSQTSSLTSTGSHVGKVIAANFAALCYLNLHNQWAMKQEALFYTRTTCHTANDDTVSVGTFLAYADNQTLENLNALFVAFTNLLVNLNSVAALNVDNFWLVVLLLDLLNNRLHI
jgi:hypothetical protein